MNSMRSLNWFFSFWVIQPITLNFRKQKSHSLHSGCLVASSRNWPVARATPAHYFEQQKVGHQTVSNTHGSIINGLRHTTGSQSTDHNNCRGRMYTKKREIEMKTWVFWEPANTTIRFLTITIRYKQPLKYKLRWSLYNSTHEHSNYYNY